ncbi:uncharacterized protein A4U43_C07F20340 [Asparagus officinalis]|uniref:non-specific serine/threonine protein kinase n=1 Tax=Asparagus officinalis TaxID=4686 RepID=A0A5P1EDF7_ASPOF|nr:receptor-like serine/threonine-protein kinase NCRK [Asparagus officinalis]XP_020274101.1 receptor-like serine/threonine-protein kinase NCRK [Asparagus officinalis]XP_020274102.1 receptor-like serine/threonine-protein kinase NCRK [Asparagus officinalis]XP_020274103.1 receptor-like serine/threonine-protein kinase NCRK [Asparagus officinalis]XP_020274104.1 receptor-like serine/threonine-protein kinase NCRK [Asparagus officinalis]ONK63926.1 uncharacterized protein A4U43_C07F20340 [Asparagus off
MELLPKISLACLCGFFVLQCVFCEEPAQVADTLVWRCTCAAAPLRALNYTPTSNCSSSCDCIPDSRGWNCSCVSNGTVQASGAIHDASCFTSCNCTSGSPGRSTAKKNLAIKGVIVILLLCVMTIGFLCSIAFYFYRKDKFSAKPPTLSSDKESSWNSRTNLISQRSASFPEYQAKINSHFNPITACFRRISFLCRSERGTLPGAIVQFPFVELEKATDKFSNANLIGIGGSSNVYRGQLLDGRVVAIKKIKLSAGPEAEYDFLTEIELISRLNHCHVVPLLGYCCEFHGKNFERLLVFEYMSNGNLRDCLDALHGKEPLDWTTRVRIALGSARGLEYLHEAAAPRILHRDIKSTNILLDEKYRAKITDLGMAKRLLSDDLTSCSNSPARMLGTFGYFAPEYAIVGKASLKSDVFSFGVVILELISGRQPIHKSPNKVDESLVIWATARLRDSRLVVTELPDPVLKGNFPEEEMHIMAHLARECLQWDPESRPSMSEVVQILSTIAPDKVKKRNFPSGLIMSSSFRSIKSGPQTDKRASSVEIPQTVQANSEKTQARCSLPLAVDRNLCDDPEKKNAHTVLSAEYMEKLILLTSGTRSWRSPDDETVDLTEPRFESFVQPNCRSL